VKEVNNRAIYELEEANRILDEYKQRLTEALVWEGERIRNEAEKESASGRASG